MAIRVSEAFRNAMKAPVKLVRATIPVSGTEQITSADNLISATVESSGYFFGTTTKTLSASLLGTAYDLIGKQIGLKFEVQTDSVANTWEECDLGVFYVYEQESNLEKGTSTIKAYDMMGKLAKREYSSGVINFPCTVEELVTQLVNNFGLEYTPKTLVNGSYIITEDLWANIDSVTYRDIFAEIAGATATIVSIDGKNNTLTLTETPRTPSETWTYSNLKSIKYNPKYGEINAVVLARAPQEDNIVVRDEASIKANGLTELKLANNEILDDNRQDLALPILNSVKGFYFYPFEATTEGHGWHQCGDYLTATDGTNSWNLAITYVKFVIDGGIKETIKGVQPEDTQTDYSLAGGIMKTIYNTEIKVDKQNQEIISVVSKQDSLENETLENFTRITQNINNITANIQNTGGSNLIQNSVGYNIDTNKQLVGWEYSEGSKIIRQSSPASVRAGALSGSSITLSANSKITQNVPVGVGMAYSLGFVTQKTAAGSFKVSLTNGTDNYVIEIPENETSSWKKYKLENIIAHENYFDVVAETDADSQDTIITDLMLNLGESCIPWSPANNEILSENVAIDTSGVTVRSGSTNDYTQLNELGLNGYSDAEGSLENVFTVNRDITEVSKLKARKQISMPPVKIVPITNGDMAGWSFVAITEE